VNFPRLDYIRYCLCLKKEKDENKKIENAKTIISILKPVNTEIEADGDHLDKPYLSTSELLIADAYSTQSMFAEAQDYFNRAVSAAEYETTVNPADYVQCQLADALRAQAKNQAKLKNFDGAVAGFKRAIEIWQKVKSKPVVVKNLADTRIMLNEANSQKSGGGRQNSGVQ
jgi:tetratricopeptide (TPR) repeat protein